MHTDAKQYYFAAIVSPLVYNAYLHPEDFGTFTCVTRNSEDIRWIINGSTHNVPYIRDTRLITVKTNQSQQLSVIMIPALPVNQHLTHIKCRAYHRPPAFRMVESVETAQFNIQGLLVMLPNISYTSYNATHNFVEWQEPETLNITNLEPDIERYTICTNVTDECFNTTTPYFILPKYFVALHVNITAWNIVGESNSSAQLEITACTQETTISNHK